MSEETKITAPEGQFEEVVEQNVPVLETTEEIIENNQIEEEVSLISEEILHDLANKSLKEIVTLFESLVEKGDQQEMYKYAEPIKAIFYKTLKKEKIAAGFVVPAEDVAAEAEEAAEVEEKVSENPFAEIERGFKEIFAKYKAIRAVHIQQVEKKKDENLEVKKQIIEELKALVETQEDIVTTFPKFRSLQTRWRESGPVPQAKVKDVYDSYQHYVEMFYDYVKINNELRDLDFKKNLEAKVALCEKAEKLVEEENVINAFATLQKLHEEWKEFGPVEKEHREAIWERFKVATSQVNKKHQAYFEKIKADQKVNLAAKTVLCEKAEEIAAREVAESNTWNEYSKELEGLQKEWKSIGFASKKDNQKIYDRFRAACDQFYNRKREYYSQFKDQMTRNMEQKIALCEQAEAMKESTDWKKTTEDLINLQKQWKEIGPVSRKKSDQIWNRFRSACDYFFDNKEKNYGGVDPQYVENLNKKLAIIEEIKAYEPEDRASDAEAMKEFMNRWNEIGFVPFKEKEKVQAMFKEALNSKFHGVSRSRRGGGKPQKETNPLRTEREKLVQKFRKKESEIATYENNIGFFASSKNADALVKELSKKIEATKAELAELEEKIKEIDNQFE
ncbi:MAG: DUF349 domain-containing protein [Bacteroidales bacterium]|nr:DUF349 domain-containing protein [Bacteroidales bacterium]